VNTMKYFDLLNDSVGKGPTKSEWINSRGYANLLVLAFGKRSLLCLPARQSSHVCLISTMGGKPVTRYCL
jgi:hypothetical protein